MKLDQLSDVSHLQLYRLLQGVEVPEFVKESAVDTEESVASLDKAAYADQITFSYPINTPSRVYVSNAFFQSKRNELTEKFGAAHVAQVEANIKNASSVFSIEKELEAYNEAYEKRASRDYETQYVCVIEDSELGTREVFPFKTAEEFQKSAEVFTQNIGNYPFDWRVQIAKSFLMKAAEVGVDELPDLICKYAGLYLPAHTSDVANEVARRANKLSSTSKIAKEQLTTLSASIREFDAFESIDEVMKIAEILYHFEQADGAYDRKNADLLPDPVDVLFIHSPEKVAQILAVVDMGGEKYSIGSLKKIAAERYKEAFGIDIDPTNEGQLRDLLPTMPLSDVSLFRELTGVQPID